MMGNGISTFGRRSALRTTTIAVLVVCLSSLAIAQTGNLVITSPGSGVSNPGSKFGMRSDPFTGNQKFHAGQDYKIGSGTRITTNAPVTDCSFKGGYGNYATVGRECGVTEHYAHLSSCSAKGSNTVTSGNTGSRTTGAHLHYEIRINGTPVNPIDAFSAGNLCDGEVRKKLLEGAKSKGGSGGTSSDKENSNTPAPTPSGTSVNVVNTGETNPTTGQVNTGPSYYVTTYADGTTSQTPIIDDGENEFSALPPSETENLTGTSQSTGDTTGCATDTWTAMVNQSVMQARRQVIYNSRYVLKPDSVMAYSCFDTTIKSIGKKLHAFSGTKKWVNKQVDILGDTVTVNVELGENSMDGAIYKTAYASAQSFINGAFPHDYLGGSQGGGGGGGGGGEESEGGGRQTDAPCSKMAEIWQQAKCTNIQDEHPFLKFSELTSAQSDPRKYPPNMKCLDTGITQDMIDIAQNKKAKFDKVEAHLDMLMPEGNKCYQTPIPTGVTVVRRDGESIISTEKTYPDGVCISPGCSYQNEGGSGNGQCEFKAGE